MTKKSSPSPTPQKNFSKSWMPRTKHSKTNVTTYATFSPISAMASLLPDAVVRFFTLINVPKKFSPSTSVSETSVCLLTSSFALPKVPLTKLSTPGRISLLHQKKSRTIKSISIHYLTANYLSRLAFKNLKLPRTQLMFSLFLISLKMKSSNR